MAKLIWRAGLVGGAVSDLDAEASESLSNGDAAIVINGSLVYFYLFDSSSVEDPDGESIVQPSDGGTGRWFVQYCFDTHSARTDNPHSVTKAQVGLGSVDNTADTAKPVSTAQQAALDLKGNVADIVDALTSTSTVAPLSANQGRVLKGLIDNITALLSSDDATLDTLQEIVDYIELNRDTLEALGISSIAGLQTALDAKADLTSFSSHASDTLNPHSVTKAQVGLGSVDNTADTAKPVSTAQQAALDLKGNVADIVDALTSTSTVAPLSANQGRVLKGLIDNITALLSSDDTTLDSLQEIVDYIELNRDTLEALGISSIAGLQTALDAKADLTSFNSHASDMLNPHSVTKAQVGLGSVDNTADTAKPVSTAQQAALDLKGNIADIVDALTSTSTVAPLSANQGRVLNSALASHSGSTSNPHSVTKAQVGLGSVDNTSDAAKPVSTAQQAALDLKGNIADIVDNLLSTSTVVPLSANQGRVLGTTIDTHKANVGNPHSVTKAQVGLGSVDNTSDTAKPVSTAQQAALDLKGNIADIVDNLLSTSTSAPLSANQGRVLKGLIDDLVVVANNLEAVLETDTTALDTLQEIVDYIELNRDTLDALGISSISGLQTALDAKADLTSFSSHASDTLNPHSVTKAQVGLGSVDNTADTAKPVSTAQQAALDLKGNIADIVDALTSTSTVAPLSANQGRVLNSALASHSGSTSNPHSVTKAQVGLGSVDNTSDAAKPVSTAQQAALDLKSNTADIVDSLTSYGTAVPLSANQGRVLKGLIDTINAALSSDDTTLDELQEIVDYIKLNRADLDALGISAIAGLQTALDAKLPLTGGVLAGSLQIGDGSADTRLIIKRSDSATGDDIQFYNGTTRVGEIGTTDTSYLRINQNTESNIYTPRHIRADGGFYVDGTTLGIGGDGILKDGSLSGTYSKDLTLNGNVIVGSLAREQAIGNGSVHVLSPGGGSFACNTSSVTGYLKITLPVSWTSSMLMMEVDIFDYAESESLKLHLGGYNYSGAGTWNRTFATVISGNPYKFYDVQFGHDGTNCAIYIGTAGSLWAYPQVKVSNFYAGFSTGATAANWQDGWEVGFTTTLGTISATMSGSLAATEAHKLTEARLLTVGNTTKTFDGSAAVSWSLTEIGLGNVDNTSDAAKPVSTAQQAALDLKLNRSGGSVSGDLEVAGEGNFSGTGAVRIPVGTTAQRPTSPVDGQIRRNSTTAQYEGYDATAGAWASIGGGAKGSSGNAVFFENDISITADYSITSGKNAMSAGPITINDGVAVTVPSGSVWTIV